ncbi:MAG: ankyrin repeat domain-containing protein [Kiritimatiellia bacterium]|nr:ankyrin repeat domain-containing protein [Lentisphaerota bacterium]
MNLPKAPPRHWALVLLICLLLAAPPLLHRFFKRSAVLHRAVRAGQLEQVSLMLRDHPSLLEARDDRQRATPLYWAVLDNQPDILEVLLAAGADTDAADKYGMTPLHKAAVFNRAAMARRLIDHAADLDARGLDFGAIRVAPLHKAAEAGATETVQVLLDAGADANVATQGANQVTPLHIAAARGHLPVIRLLVDSGAKVNSRDVNRTTPLFWARRMERQDAVDLLRLLGGHE